MVGKLRDNGKTNQRYDDGRNVEVNRIRFGAAANFRGNVGNRFKDEGGGGPG